jgi:hypothetical protein
VILCSCSSSLAGVSPVRVAARRPGSRLAAWSGNGSGRSPVSKALLGERLNGPQHDAKPAASLEVLPVRVGAGGAEPLKARRRPWTWVKSLEAQPAMNPPAYGAWNVQIVTAGTGEALPGPVTCDVVAGASYLITGSRREVGVEPGGRRRRP